MSTRDDRSRIEVGALSQTRGQDEIEKGKVGEGILLEIFLKMSIHFMYLNVKRLKYFGFC
jgi:hypothetical protein